MTYTVRIERDESGAWLARVPAVPGCRTHGRSLRQVKRRIREDLSLRVADAHRAELSFEIQLPPDARHLVRTAHSARDAADRTQREARETTRRAAGELTKSFGLSVRDAADLLGLSHQRVQQLLESGSRRRLRDRSRKQAGDNEGRSVSRRQGPGKSRDRRAVRRRSSVR
jgi:predicted RNase H-like HicB family nuclease